MVFYEAPHRLVKTLDDLYNAFGEREAAVVKEITKTHENTKKTTLKDAVLYYKTETPKGEYVLIVAGAKAKQTEYTLEQAVQLGKSLVEKGERKTEAARAAAEITGVKKSEIYKELL